MPTLGKIIPLLLLLALPAPCRGDQTTLEQAELHYQNGEWEKALQLYKTARESVAKPSQLSPAFYFNYGTTLARAGQHGAAYVALLRAEFARPFDSDIRANLAAAERNIPAAIQSVRPSEWFTWWPSWALPLPWQLWLSAALLSSFLALLTIGGAARAASLTFAGAATLLLLATALTFYQQHLPVAGVITSTKVKSGPSGSFPDITTLEPGSIVNVETSRDGWLKIRFLKADSQETVGWTEPAALLEVH